MSHCLLRSRPGNPIATTAKNDVPWLATESTYIAFFVTKIKCWGVEGEGGMQPDLPSKYFILAQYLNKICIQRLPKIHLKTMKKYFIQ